MPSYRAYTCGMIQGYRGGKKPHKVYLMRINEENSFLLSENRTLQPVRKPRCVLHNVLHNDISKRKTP